MILITCIECGKQRMETDARVKKGYGKYCSHRCYIVAWRKNPPPKFFIKTPETIEKLRLAQTGKKIPYHPHPKAKGRWIGEKNPRWKGGHSGTKQFKAHLESVRRARKSGNGGSHTFEQWLHVKAFHSYLCAGCGNMEPFIKLSKDHIVPLSRGGGDDVSNIQPMCLPCNVRKQNKIDWLYCEN